jgi:hypothetical protein
MDDAFPHIEYEGVRVSTRGSKLVMGYPSTSTNPQQIKQELRNYGWPDRVVQRIDRVLLPEVDAGQDESA